MDVLGCGEALRNNVRRLESVGYYWFDSEDQIALIFGYAKNDQEDLTSAQLKQLSALMKEMNL